jgi:hypothetical protein
MTEAALGRIGRWMAGVAAAGFVAAFLAGGWRLAAGFLLGGLISALNYRWLKKVVGGLGEQTEGQPPPRPRSAVFLGLRYFLLGGVAYVILMFSTISLTGVLMGLFVPAAAVILEILFELVYAGT